MKEFIVFLAKILTMNKLFILSLLCLIVSIKSQKIDLTKIKSDVKNKVFENVKNNNDLVDFKFDTITVEYLTEKKAIMETFDYITKKSKLEMDKYELDFKNAKALPYPENIEKLKELSKILTTINITSRQKVLLAKFQNADSNKNYIIFSKASYYLKLKDENPNDFFSGYFFYDLEGNYIKDIYTYIILKE